MTWTAEHTNGEYVIYDHNDTEQGRLSDDGTISTDDVRDVMHDRCATLRDDLQRGGGNSPVDIETVMEWTTIIEDMAGDQIELPETGT